MPGITQGPRLSQQLRSQRILFVTTALTLCLALFAFMTQWTGGDIEDSAQLGEIAGDDARLPGAKDPVNSILGGRLASSSGCGKVLASHNGMLPNHIRWQQVTQNELSSKIAITSSTSAGLEQILPWLYYHRVVGVTHFLLFVEGQAASLNSTSTLEAIPGVKIIQHTEELQNQQAKSRIWNETWLSGFFWKPCNYELFVKQSLNMETAIVFAREIGIDWIIHLDTDELLYPAGAPEYSVQRLLHSIASDVDMVVFPNYESAIERDDLEEPFREVTMFKRNYDHVSKEIYFALYKEATRGNPNYFLTYGNGKAAARIKDHLRPNGAHRWHNYAKAPNEIKLDEAAVLHYTYAKFSDLTSRRDRCHCKPTREDVKRCFMLDFDREAFIIASTASEEEMKRWYREHVVWTDKELILKLMRRGLLTRLYAPQAIMQGLQEAGVFKNAVRVGQDRLAKYLQQEHSFLRSSSAVKFPNGSTSDSGLISDAIPNGFSRAKEASTRAAMPPLSPPSLHHLGSNLSSSSEGNQ